uniref:Fibronectin type-III domain-containing protein n=1 Tax=Monopterus albus TaxID=43700 RepID=A0A3Q3K5F1_MONAL
DRRGLFKINRKFTESLITGRPYSAGIREPELPQEIRLLYPKLSFMVEFKLQDGATSYIVRVEDNNGFFREDPVNFSPAEVTSLTPFTEYTLSIMSVNVGGRSQPSLPVTAKTGTVVYHIIFICEQNDRF